MAPAMDFVAGLAAVEVSAMPARGADLRHVEALYSPPFCCYNSGMLLLAIPRPLRITSPARP